MITKKGFRACEADIFAVEPSAEPSAKPSAATASAKPSAATASAKPSAATASAKPSAATASAKPSAATASEVEPREAEELLYVRTFGEFCIMYGDKKLSGDKVKSRQGWALLEYIIGNRNLESSRERLMEELWDGGSDDPANALKNLAYRARTMFKEHLGIDGSKYIVSSHGSYCWNKNAAEVDADRFEWLVKCSNPKYMAEAEALDNYLQAIELYKGRYMPQSEHKVWAMHQSVYYHNLFMEAVAGAGEILERTFRYERLEEINRLAVAHDKYSEENHAKIIVALHGQGKRAQALAYYERVRILLLNELGVEPTDVITDLYKVITSEDKGAEKSVYELESDLRAGECSDGATLCSYDTLKAIFSVFSRTAERSGKRVQALLLTVKAHKKKKYFEENIDEIAETAAAIVCRTLRKNDVIARCAKYQFAILLNNAEESGVGVVVKRLKAAFDADVNGEFWGIRVEKLSLEPAKCVK